MMKKNHLIAVSIACAAFFCLMLGMKIQANGHPSAPLLDEVESLTFCEGSATADYKGKKVKVSIRCEGEGRCKMRKYGVTVTCSGRKIAE